MVNMDAKNCHEKDTNNMLNMYIYGTLSIFMERQRTFHADANCHEKKMLLASNCYEKQMISNMIYHKTVDELTISRFTWFTPQQQILVRGDQPVSVFH